MTPATTDDPFAHDCSAWARVYAPLVADLRAHHVRQHQQLTAHNRVPPEQGRLPGARDTADHDYRVP